MSRDDEILATLERIETRLARIDEEQDQSSTNRAFWVQFSMAMGLIVAGGSYSNTNVTVGTLLFALGFTWLLFAPEIARRSKQTKARRQRDQLTSSSKLSDADHAPHKGIDRSSVR